MEGGLSNPGAAAPRLSICIATFGRGKFIGETLDSVLGQWEPGVELVVVDGASPDDTPQVMAQYVSQNPGIAYYREHENSGVDRDYDKAVGYARGDYCWLMPDDDLLRPGAIAAVLGVLDRGLDLVVVNAEVRNADFSKQLVPRLLDFPDNREYGAPDRERFFSEIATSLSFIGCAVVRREAWLGRDRASYYGSLFVHVGVIFQHPPIERVTVIAAPLITIRYGNAMWTPRWFEIWLFKWPHLVWSFVDFSDRAKAAVCPREPWKDFKWLLFCRATGGYTPNEYRRHLSGKVGGVRRVLSYAIAMIPGTVANAVASLYFMLLKRDSRISIHNLSRSAHANAVSHWVARVLDV
jgi:abequosyltransferase